MRAGPPSGSESSLASKLLDFRDARLVLREKAGELLRAAMNAECEAFLEPHRPRGEFNAQNCVNTDGGVRACVGTGECNSKWKQALLLHDILRANVKNICGGIRRGNC